MLSSLSYILGAKRLVGRNDKWGETTRGEMTRGETSWGETTGRKWFGGETSRIPTVTVTVPLVPLIGKDGDDVIDKITCELTGTESINTQT